jgi:hypothetical protein
MQFFFSFASDMKKRKRHRSEGLMEYVSEKQKVAQEIHDKEAKEAMDVLDPLIELQNDLQKSQSELKKVRSLALFRRRKL